MATFSKKVMGKEVGDASVYAPPHNMSGEAGVDIKNAFGLWDREITNSAGGGPQYLGRSEGGVLANAATVLSGTPGTCGRGCGEAKPAAAP